MITAIVKNLETIQRRHESYDMRRKMLKKKATNQLNNLDKTEVFQFCCLAKKDQIPCRSGVNFSGSNAKMRKQT